MRDALKTDELRQEMKQSMTFPVELLNTQMKRLALKDRQFQVFDAADDISIDRLWDKCNEVDSDLQVSYYFLK